MRPGLGRPRPDGIQCDLDNRWQLGARGKREGPPRGCGTALRTGTDYSARRRRAAMPPSTSMNVPVVDPEAGLTR